MAHDIPNNPPHYPQQTASPGAQPLYPPPASPPGRILAVVSLVLLLFIPALLSLILSYVARSLDKRAGMSDATAVVAIVLSWIFTAFQIVFVVILVWLQAQTDAGHPFG